CRELYRRPSRPARERQSLIGPALIGSALIIEGIADEDGVLALRAGREERDRRLDELLDAADVLDRGRRQIGPAPRPARRFRPALEGFVDGLERRLRGGPRR